MQSIFDDADSPARGSFQFASTHWSTVLAAGDSASPDSREALERLCRAYWYPVYAAVRAQGYRVEDAKDLTQAFFERLIEKQFLKDVAPERGRFRCFLLKALTHFLANQGDRERAAKRGGEYTRVDLDVAALEERYAAEASNEESVERHFDRRWAATVMDQALSALETEFVKGDKGAQFEALAAFLSRPPNPGEYERVGEQLGLNAHAVTVSVARLRERYRSLVRDEVAQTVDDPTEVGAEWRYLVELMAG